MFKRIFKRMVLLQRNFRTFSGLCTISNQFQARAGSGLYFRTRAGYGFDLIGSFTTLDRDQVSRVARLQFSLLSTLLTAFILF